MRPSVRSGRAHGRLSSAKAPVGQTYISLRTRQRLAGQFISQRHRLESGRYVPYANTNAHRLELSPRALLNRDLTSGPSPTFFRVATQLSKLRLCHGVSVFDASFHREDDMIKVDFTVSAQRAAASPLPPPVPRRSVHRKRLRNVDAPSALLTTDSRFTFGRGRPPQAWRYRPITWAQALAWRRRVCAHGCATQVV